LAGQGKLADQRPTFYHCTTPPAVCYSEADDGGDDDDDDDDDNVESNVLNVLAARSVWSWLIAGGLESAAKLSSHKLLNLIQ